jgi:hypothetical protein
MMLIRCFAVLAALAVAQQDYPDSYQDYADDYQDNLYHNYAQHAQEKQAGGGGGYVACCFWFPRSII